MSEFKLERFKYNWIGTWTPSYSYNRDDVVNVGGRTYVCLVTHTSSPDFNTDLDATVPGSDPPIPAPRWTLMVDGRRFIGAWSTGVQYQESDIVTYQGSIHVCINGHLSTTFHANATDWDYISKNIEHKQDWGQATNYGVGAVVTYNGIVYKCITAHASQTFLEDDIANWEILYSGGYFAGNWTTATLYRLNDYVKFGGSIFKVNNKAYKNLCSS